MGCIYVVYKTESLVNILFYFICCFKGFCIFVGKWFLSCSVSG